MGVESVRHDVKPFRGAARRVVRADPERVLADRAPTVLTNNTRTKVVTQAERLVTGAGEFHERTRRVFGRASWYKSEVAGAIEEIKA